MYSKGVSEIISSVLIIVIAIGLVATAYTWGLPLIIKVQNQKSVDDVTAAFNPNNFNSLPSQIFTVFSNGGERTYTLGVNGLWTLKADDPLDSDSNYIEFYFVSKVSDIAWDAGWLSSQGACPPDKGVLNNDNFYVICTRADSVSDGYKISYRVYYRELDSSVSNTGQKIKIIPTGGITTSAGTSMRISRGTITQSDVGGKTLTITEIKILLS